MADKTELILEKYANGEMGTDTCARLLALECMRDLNPDMSDEDLAALELELEIAQGK